MSPSPAPAVKVLSDERLLRGHVFVVGPGAVEAATGLAGEDVSVTVGVADAAGRKAAKSAGVRAVAFDLKAPRVPKGVDAILDQGLVAAVSDRGRKALVSALLDKLPLAGTLFVAGPARPAPGKTFTPSSVKAATNPKAVRVHPALNTRDGDGKGIVVPVEKVTRVPSKAEVAVGTKPVPKVKAARPSARVADDGLEFVAAAAPANPASLVQRQHIMNAIPLVALQKCHSWCWAAGLQMLCKSQGFDVAQEVFVKKIFGVNSSGQPPCVMSGPWANIKKALDGTVGTVSGKTLTLTGEIIEGISTGANVRRLVQNIAANEPFLFGYNAHILLCHGATWVERADGTGPIQITRLELIDPFPTNLRFNFVKFPANALTLSQIMGVMLIDVTS